MIRNIVLMLLIGWVCGDMPEIWLGDATSEQRIIKGEDANEGEFPYMASLRRINWTWPGHSCGASILTTKWVLSAAHCCAGILNNHHIYVGSVYLSKGGSNHTIEKVIMHKEYDPGKKWRNDICVIKVSKPFTFGDKIKPITLAPQDWPVNSGDKVTISGWGRTKPVESGCIPDRLQKGVNFTAWSQEECKAKAGLDPFPGYLCAVGTHKEQCTWNGDSGGPLVKGGIQVGLTSFGYRPYGNGMPTVYCRVTNYINWIKQMLGEDASQLKIYQPKYL